MRRVLLIVDHGSRWGAANGVIEQLVQLVQARAGSEVEVRFAHLEIAEPSLGDVIDASVGAGAREIVVQPLFLAPGRHAARDVPEIVAAARARHQHVDFRVGDVIGADPLLAELLWLRSGFSRGASG